MNTEKLKELWEKVKKGVGKVSRKIWIIAAVVIVAIAAGITIFLNTRPYSILITGASASEVATVTNWLEGQNIQTYRYKGNDTILVPEGQAVALKAALLTEMYQDGSASSFSGYFDNVSMLSTEEERSKAWLVALEEKLAAVISAMEGVQSATVDIAEGEDRGYVLDSGNVVEASATVMVTMRSGKSLTGQLASAIRAYVSGGVQGLTVDAVTVMDNNGNIPIGGISGESEYNSTSAAKMQMEQYYEYSIQNSVLQLLEPLFGPGHVKVAANVIVELGNRTEVTHDVWIPDYVDSREDGKGIIGSEAYAYQYIANGEVIAGGLVGTGANSDIVTDVERLPTLDDTNGKLEGDGQIDYNNPYSDITVYATAGRVTDCTVAVTIDANTATDVNLSGLRSHVATAAGISPVVTETMTADEYLTQKVSIYVGRFYQEESTGNNPLVPDGNGLIFGIIPWWVLAAAAAGLLLFIILLVLILVLRGRRKKKKQQEAERLAQEQQQEQQLTEELLASVGVPQLEPVGADVMSLRTEKSMELRQDIRQFAEENPEVAAQLLKSWLRGGEEHG